ncbi:MAG: L,D-transpeptidase family protein [Sphingobacteriales bacterium]
MKRPENITYRLKQNVKLCILLGAGALMTCFSIGEANARCTSGKTCPIYENTDTALSGSIRKQIILNEKHLNYPASVARFYQQSGYKLFWIAPDTVKMRASEAMLMLDCVMQYGLNPPDYHPRELLYEKLNELTRHFGKVSDMEKAGFDVILTDAMLTFINNLHFGKLNPDCSSAKIDSGNTPGFLAETVLAKALHQKKFMETLLSVQPKLKAYTDLQFHLHLLAGLYTGDCYEVPEGDIRKISINMERLRWIKDNDTTYIHINIPSFTLEFHQPDTIYQFKVVIGKPEAPTPTLESAIKYFTTAPEWKVPAKIFIRELLPRTRNNPDYFRNHHYNIYDNNGNYVADNAANRAMVRRDPGNYGVRQSAGCDNSLGLIVFRFPNIYDIYLHDTPEQQLFKKETRAYSHGCIRVEQAEKLAELLLANDASTDKISELKNALKKYITKSFYLKKAVPIKITYLTCGVKDGVLQTYDDLYDLDKGMETGLYTADMTLPVN